MWGRRVVKYRRVIDVSIEDSRIYSEVSNAWNHIIPYIIEVSGYTKAEYDPL